MMKRPPRTRSDTSRAAPEEKKKSGNKVSSILIKPTKIEYRTSFEVLPGLLTV